MARARKKKSANARASRTPRTRRPVVPPVEPGPEQEPNRLKRFFRLLGPGLVVSDDEVLDAMETAFREYKLVVEPGGAVALAAALTGKLPVKGRAVAVVCSGGNVDHATFIRALSRRST